jgi:hypothetical protein
MDVWPERATEQAAAYFLDALRIVDLLYLLTRATIYLPNPSVEGYADEAVGGPVDALPKISWSARNSA